MSARRDLPAYVELVCRSCFSFLEGASHPEELVDQAVALGLGGLALTDQGGVYGVVRAHMRLRELVHEGRVSADRFHFLVGARLHVAGMPPFVLIAQDGRGYGNLCALISRGQQRGEKGSCTLDFEDLAPFKDQLIILALDTEARGIEIGQLREIYGPNLFLGISRQHHPAAERRLRRLITVGRAQGIPAVAVGDVLYHHPQRQVLQDVLRCIQLGCTLEEAGRRLEPNGERFLRAPEMMLRLFADFPHAVERSAEIAQACSFSLDSLSYRYPSEVLSGSAPDATSAMEQLRICVAQGLGARYPDGVAPDIEAQASRELQLIEKLEFPHYFLTVYDIVRFAQNRGILCQGRGSAANSVVCFALGITAVDPLHGNLLFERFISEERGEPPDIDVDFEHERREEVIQYLYEKYGRRRAAMACAYVCYRGRSALRDIGKVMGFSQAKIELLSRLMIRGRRREISPDLFDEAGFDPGDQKVRTYGALIKQLLHFPRHLSIHSGGFVLSDTFLDRMVPIENAAMEGRTVIQWDKNDLNALGLLKIDVLSLGILTCLRKAFALVDEHEGVKLSLAAIPPDDEEVYEQICRANTVGVFQIESRAQMGMLPRLRPRNFYDLVVQIAIIRPGPIQGKMVHPYLRRRNGEEEVRYPHPALKEILSRTYGVPIFQEQVMRLAVAVAGFTPGEADELRRAMGGWRKSGKIHALGKKLRDGMRENNLSEEFSAQILQQIEGFAEYGFPESHSASFALLVYASAYLKVHHQAAFTCALLNSQPMGFYAPRTLIADAQRHGVLVLPIDIQESGWDCDLESFWDRAGQRRCALRLGMRLIKGLQRRAAQRLVEVRARAGKFSAISELQAISGVRRRSWKALAAAGAMESLGVDRRKALWTVAGFQASTGDLLTGAEALYEDAHLPEASSLDELKADYRSTGFCVHTHPLALIRETLTREGVLFSTDLLEAPHGRWVEVAGIVVARQQPATASGVLFIALEDEKGMLNVVVWPRTFEKYRAIVGGASILRVEGKLERKGLVANLIAHRFTRLTLGHSHFQFPAAVDPATPVV